jgi:hypothetical protein
MSNYYLSNCCYAEVSEVDPDTKVGRCLKCGEMCEAVVEEDVEEIPEMKGTLEALKNLNLK